VDVVTGWKDYIYYVDPSFLWAYWYIRAIKDHDVYAIYIYTSYFWTDQALMYALVAIFAMAFSTFHYCAAAHSTASWFGTLLADRILAEDFPMNIISSLFLLFGYVGAVSSMATITNPADFSPVLGVCTSVGGMFVSLAIGFVIGVIRVMFFSALLNRGDTKSSNKS
jgi:hypothetical protein